MTTENKKNNKVHIGKVIDAHGIRGEIYGLVFSGDTSWISEVKSLDLNNENFEILKIKPFKKGFIVSLKGFTDRNKAETYKGAEIRVTADIFTSKEGEAIYLSELLNFTVSDQNLGVIGQIGSFSTNSSQDLLVISNNGKSHEIPFVKEFVINIDYTKRIINMNLPNGMLEINEPDTND